MSQHGIVSISDTELKRLYDNAVTHFQAIESNRFHTRMDFDSFFNMTQARRPGIIHNEEQELLGNIQKRLKNDTVTIHNFGKELMIQLHSNSYGSLKYHLKTNNTLEETVKTLLQQASPLPIKELQTTVHRYYDWLLHFMDRELEKFAEEHRLHHASLLTPVTPNPHVKATAYPVQNHELYKNLPSNTPMLSHGTLMHTVETNSRFFYQFDDT
jgi:hypothetical protein